MLLPPEDTIDPKVSSSVGVLHGGSCFQSDFHQSRDPGHADCPQHWPGMSAWQDTFHGGSRHHVLKFWTNGEFP